MIAFAKSYGCHFLKILCWGGLVLLLAGPSLAQEQTGKKEPAPPASKTLPQAKPKMITPDMREMPAEAAKPPEQMRLRKSVDRTFGGQEVRAREEQKETK